MATARVISFPSKRVVTAVWTGLAEDEDGDAVDIARWQDKTVQVVGTFSSENVTIQGSLDGTNWFTLHDLQDGDLIFTVDALSAIQENVLFIRPSVGTGGGVGTVDVDVIISGVAAP